MFDNYLYFGHTLHHMKQQANRFNMINITMVRAYQQISFGRRKQHAAPEHIHLPDNLISGVLDCTVSICSAFVTSRPFLKTAGGIVLGSVAVSAVSADVLPYISVAIKASFLKLGMCNICKNNIAKMFLDFKKILNCSFNIGF